MFSTKCPCGVAGVSITLVQDKRVTVITVETDRTTMLPPLQILKTLWFSMQSCSLFRRADGLMQSNTVSALGTIQIMVGLFNIGLGPGRTTLHPGDFAHLGAAYWLGGVCILTGIVSLLADRCSGSFLVGTAVLMNIIGSIFSIIGIYMYAMDIDDITHVGFCDNSSARSYDDCEFVELFFKRMLKGMDTTMIVLTVLQLIVCITVTVLGIRVLFHLRNKEDARDDDIYQPETKEALLTGPDSPLQILKTLCFSTQSCSLFRRADGLMQSNTVSALGTLQIMVGLFNIGLGSGRTRLHPGDFVSWEVAYWLGGMFILAGIMSFTVDRFSSVYLVGFAVAVNTIGSILALIGSVLYGADILDFSELSLCDESNVRYSPCQSTQYLLQRLVIGMDISMIVLTVLQLIVCITVTVLGIRVLFYLRNKEQDAGDDEIYQPEMKEALLTGPGA
ncbi:uncharacterized protein LOC131977036 isoform X2 [Centropristis striata]|uniref:uncharacterized protein LOC131977036 isoform X2 n=1 Tax=Centropristis striata TaxID=184440 RepID=UPI0027DF5E98|nr:uncharacterized protein LOC131977036 isoform X2 [Centropristis striata]